MSLERAAPVPVQGHREGGSVVSGGVREAWAGVVSLLFPPVCGLCGTGEATVDQGMVCADCRRAPGHLRPIGDSRCGKCGLPYPGDFSGEFVCSNCAGLRLDFRHARAAVAATPFVLEIIHRYKYRNARWFEPFLGELLCRAAGPALRDGSWSGLVPVPLHPLREREREFNQAQRLARRLSRETGIPVRSDCLRRARETRTQALLDRTERAKNVAGAFLVNEGVRLDGGRYVLVDDVLTTGATTSAASRALRAAGAEDVVVWTVARGI